MSCIPTFSCALATKGANANAEVAAMAWRRVTRDFILHLPYCRTCSRRARGGGQAHNPTTADGRGAGRVEKRERAGGRLRERHGQARLDPIVAVRWKPL